MAENSGLFGSFDCDDYLALDFIDKKMISWIASALTLLGNIVLIKHKSWKAFVIFFVGNSLWAYHWLEKKEWAALLLVVIFIGTNIWGIISWRKK